MVTEVPVKIKYHYKEKKVYDAIKRVFDIVSSAAALVLLSPVMLVAAILIKHEDGGPVMFKQVRLTRNGKPFTMYKFRSMCEDAEEKRATLADSNEMTGPAFKMKNDPRVTKIGRVLRKTSIDELPQLVNILKGEMSVVGPRPPLPSEVEQYEEWQKHRLDVKGGLTCYWQCSGRSNVDFDRWVKLDLQYIMDRGIWTDVKILFRTVGAVLRQDGAE
ncbi:MAG: sugar transferase [Butyricicoccaceae bacterium]